MRIVEALTLVEQITQHMQKQLSTKPSLQQQSKK